MELVRELVNNQLVVVLLPALTGILLVLVYTFSIKSGKQPSFEKLTDDRKQAGKKKKIKEKRTTSNGHVATGEGKNEKSPVKDSKKSPTKESNDSQKSKDKKNENNKQTEKNKKNEAIKNKVIEEVSNKKNSKKMLNEKPVDFDDGKWVTIPTKADKKKKAEQSPAKKEKNNKKSEKLAEIDKLVKEVVNKELREKDKENKIENEKIDEPVQEEPVVIIEEKKEKKKEKKVKKEVEKVEKETNVQKEVVKPPEEVLEEAPPSDKGGVAFDELGDVWSETKPAKKSKKKARRDN